jgi:signal peptidase II
MTAMTRRWGQALLALGTIGMVGCDHATKLAAHSMLANHAAVGLIPGVLDLRYTENRDAAFSVGRSLIGPWKQGLLIALPAIASVAILVAWRASKSSSRVEHVGFALVVAGALGNLIDRVARGFVVDFIELHRWPIFNVADVAVAVGAGLLALAHAQRRSPIP